METSPSTADDAVGQSFDFDSNVCRISDSVMREDDDPISFLKKKFFAQKNAKNQKNAEKRRKTKIAMDACRLKKKKKRRRVLFRLTPSF